MVSTRSAARRALGGMSTRLSPAAAKAGPPLRRQHKRAARRDTRRSAASQASQAGSPGSPAAAPPSPPAAAAEEELALETLDARASLKQGMRQLEQRLQAEGHACIVGVDEAGRGPLCGPVVAGACHIPLDVTIEGIDDSKELSEPQREAAYEALTTHPRVRWAVAECDHATIDEINILQATMLAMRNAVASLAGEGDAPDAVLVDGNRRPWGNPEGKQAKGGIRPADPPPPAGLRKCIAVIKGDGHVRAIAAASVLAKVHRDRVMQQLAVQYPEYGMEGHKGYPSAAHKAAVAKHGPSPVHRLTFRGVKEHVR